jgi:flagellar assembly factor FliW
LNIQTTRFGDIDVPDECIIQFETGMLGFPQQKQFALFPYEPESAFFFLQSTTEPNLTFLMADPYRFFNDYEFELDDTLATKMELGGDNPPHVYVVATLKENLEDTTVNLVAPVVVSWKKREALQVILDNKAYTIKQPLFPEGLPGGKPSADAGQGG